MTNTQVKSALSDGGGAGRGGDVSSTGEEAVGTVECVWCPCEIPTSVGNHQQSLQPLHPAVSTTKTSMFRRLLCLSANKKRCIQLKRFFPAMFSVLTRGDTFVSPPKRNTQNLTSELWADGGGGRDINPQPANHTAGSWRLVVIVVMVTFPSGYFSPVFVVWCEPLPPPPRFLHPTP